MQTSPASMTSRCSGNTRPLSGSARRFWPLLAASAVLFGIAGPAAALDQSMLIVTPPDRDWRVVCAGPAKQRPAVDWRQRKAPFRAPSADLMQAADYYASSQDTATAAKLLRDVAARDDGQSAAAAYRLATLILDGDVVAAEGESALGLLETAFKGRYPDAARTLGRVYHRGLEGLQPNPKEALRYYRIAAAAGVGAAYLDVANLVASWDLPEVSEAERDAILVEVVGTITRGAAEGQCEILLQAGRLYEIGRVLPQDGDVAVQWLTAARDGGSITAALALGRIYLDGLLVEADPAKARENYALAAAAGDRSGMLSVSRILVRGDDGVEQDLKTAESYLNVLAEEGSTDARKLLLRLYSGDYGTERRSADLVAAVDRYRSDDIVTPAQLRGAGQVLLEGDDVPADAERGIALLKDAAAEGDSQAAKVVGDAYETGNGIAVDQSEARRYYIRAAELGSAGAMDALSERSFCGRGEPRDPIAGRVWSERAVAAGGGILSYIFGESRPADAQASLSTDERFRLLVETAEAGQPKAIAAVARSYRYGQSIAADAAEADRWLAIASAPEADGEALLHLGEMAAAGQFGPRDVDEAEARLKDAADHKFPRAQHAYALLILDRGEVALSDVKALLLEAAEAGYAASARELALLMSETESLGGRNRGDWFALAAEEGDLKAKLALIDRETDVEKAEALIDAADRSGTVCNAADVLSLVEAYHKLGTASATVKARTLLMLAEGYETDDPRALALLGRLLSEGAGGLDRVADALPVLERAWTLGNTDSGIALAEGQMNGLFAKNVERGVDLLLAVAKAGDARATDRLADLIQAKAVKLTQTQIDDIQGLLDRDASTSVRLSRTYGFIISAGAFGEDRRPEGVKLIEQAAEQGDLAAMRWLARAATTGQLMDRSPQTAAAWLLKAAELGDPQAMFQLSAAYEAGFGVSKDKAKSVDWRSRAIEAGYKP